VKVKPRFDWRHQYDENRDQVEGDLAATANEGEDLCQQQYAESADINVSSPASASTKTRSPDGSGPPLLRGLL